LFKYYLYGHKRLDNNQYFYIGVGTKSTRNYSTVKSIYYRAHTKKGRNRIWHRIVNKAGYYVEILTESNFYEDIKLAEQHYIQIFGKIIDKSGVLCNISDGGEGTLGVVKPRGIDSKFSKSVHQFDLNGQFIKTWDCAQTVQRELSIHANSICNCCNRPNVNKSAGGFIWSYTCDIPQVINTTKSVYQYSKYNRLLYTWSSITEAANTLNLNSSLIRDCINGKRTTYDNFIWRTEKI
jgi:hypothetical protein